MKTMTEHNAEARRRIAEQRSRTTQPKGIDIACDECGAELELCGKEPVNFSDPPTLWVVCKCGHRHLMVL